MVNLTLKISDELHALLEAQAREQHKSVEEVAEEVIQTHIRSTPPKNAFLMIAEAADRLGHESKEDDIAERSREILSTEFPDYLRKRRDKE